MPPEARSDGPDAPHRSPLDPPSLWIVLSGPAGSGKTTLCDRLVATHPGVARVVTSTTRPPRPGERDREHYYFFTEAEFEARASAGEFLESARVHAHRYGTLRSEILSKLERGLDLVMNVDVQGAAAFRAAAAADASLARRLVTVFLHPPALDAMAARLRGRGATEEDIARRMATARTEIAAWRDFDHCIVSGTRDADFAALQAIWQAERLRSSRR